MDEVEVEVKVESVWCSLWGLELVSATMQNLDRDLVMMRLCFLGELSL